MQIDYDALYIELTLKPGASPEQIQAAWKELSRLIHPDIKDPGPIQETATRRMSLVNDARDKLLAYWQQHNAPPPSRFQQQVAVSTPAPEGPKEKTWQEEAYEDWRKEYTDKKTQERNTANSYQQHHHGPPDEPPAAQRTPTPGFSPPAFSKLPHHHIYDFLNRQDKESMAPLVLGLASFMVPMFIVLMILGTLGQIIGIPGGYWMNESPYMLINLILTTVLAVVWYRFFLADTELYEIRTNPYLKPALRTAQGAIETITSAVTANTFSGQTWTLLESKFDDHLQAFTSSFRLTSSPGVMLRTRVMAVTPTSSLVCYWFEMNGLPLWRVPVAKAVRRTDTALWKALS